MKKGSVASNGYKHQDHCLVAIPLVVRRPEEPPRIDGQPRPVATFTERCLLTRELLGESRAVRGDARLWTGPGSVCLCAATPWCRWGARYSSTRPQGLAGDWGPAQQQQSVICRLPSSAGASEPRRRSHFRDRPRQGDSVAVEARTSRMPPGEGGHPCSGHAGTRQHELQRF